MALAAGTLVFAAYAGDDVNGSPLGTLTEAFDKRIGLEANGVGNGYLTLNSQSSQLSWIEQGNYVKAWRDSISGDALAGFWIETGNDVVLSIDETGGQHYTRGGRGSIAVLEEALVWHCAISGGSGQVQRSKGRWLWKDAHPARCLVRLLEEAQARGGLADVTWDFTRSTDSDGNAWDLDDYADRFAFDIGMNLLEVVAELREAGLYLSMDANLVLSAYEEDAYGSDVSSTVDFVEGDNIRDTSERGIRAHKGKSTVLVGGENRRGVVRYRAKRDSSIETDLGRRKEGFFAFPRTATKAILERVGVRKLARWKKQYDGPLTLGVIDSTNRVALVDYTVGDTVEVDIPGVYDTVSETVAGIMLVQSKGSGEYDPIIDLGDNPHDSVTGRYLGGDREGINPCGCGSTGAWGTGGTGGAGSDAEAASDAGVDTAGYLLDGFDRMPMEVATALTESAASTSHTIDLPDGSDVADRLLVVWLCIGPYISGSEETEMDTEMASDGFSPVGDFVDYGSSYERYAKTYYKTTDGSDGSSFGVTFTGSCTLMAFASLVAGASSVEAEGVIDSDADPPSLDPSWAESTYALWYTIGSMGEGSSPEYDPETITLSGEPDGYGDVGAMGDGIYYARVSSRFADSQTQDPTAYSGECDAFRGCAFTIAIQGDGSIGPLGSTPTPDITGAWWPGDNPWTLTGSAEDQVSLVDSTHLHIEDDTADLLTFTATIDTDDGYLPMEYGEWDMLIDYELTGQGDPADAGTRYIAFSWDGVNSCILYLGDGYIAEGIRVTGDASDTEAKTLPEGERAYLRFRQADSRLYARTWAQSATEPSTWDVESDEEPPLGDDSTGTFRIYGGIGNDGSTQEFDVYSITVSLLPGPGDTLERHFLAYGDGSTVTFTTDFAFEPGTLEVWVDGVSVAPASYDADAGTFTLDAAPYGDPSDETGSSVLEVAYERAG